jgi:hypothetical protein
VCRSRHRACGPGMTSRPGVRRGSTGGGLWGSQRCLFRSFVGAQFVNDDGDTKQGIPGFVPGAFIVAALLALLFCVLSLYNWARIRWTLTRWPWRTMQSHFEEINRFGTPNGQPVLTLDAEGQHRILTLVAIRYRWRRFRQSELLVCGHPGRGAVIAALDRSSIGWAGRSPLRAFILRLTAFILRRHGKRDEA